MTPRTARTSGAHAQVALGDRQIGLNYEAVRRRHDGPSTSAFRRPRTRRGRSSESKAGKASTGGSLALARVADASNNASVPTGVFEGNALGREKRVEALAGAELVDLCDELLAPIPFSCRSASCGTCQVEVLEGAVLLEAPSELERELLDLLAGPANNRLACQARIRGEPGLIRLRPVRT